MAQHSVSIVNQDTYKSNQTHDFAKISNPVAQSSSGSLTLRVTVIAKLVMATSKLELSIASCSSYSSSNQCHTRLLQYFPTLLKWLEDIRVLRVLEYIRDTRILKKGFISHCHIEMVRKKYLVKSLQLHYQRLVQNSIEALAHGLAYLPFDSKLVLLPHSVRSIIYSSYSYSIPHRTWDTRKYSSRVYSSKVYSWSLLIANDIRLF